MELAFYVCEYKKCSCRCTTYKHTEKNVCEWHSNDIIIIREMNKTEIDSVVCENTIDCCACDRRKKNKSNKWILNFSIVHEPITADCDEILAKRVKFWIFQPMSGHRRKKSSWPENPSHRFEVLAYGVLYTFIPFFIYNNEYTHISSQFSLTDLYKVSTKRKVMVNWKVHSA